MSFMVKILQVELAQNRKKEREGGRKGGKEEGRKGVKEEGKKTEKERERERERESEREREREREREQQYYSMIFYQMKQKMTIRLKNELMKSNSEKSTRKNMFLHLFMPNFSIRS